MVHDNSYLWLFLFHLFPVNGIRKTGPKENWSLWKLVLLQNLLGKFVQKFSDRIFWHNNDQCRRFIAAVDSKPMSLSWMRWQSQADITNSIFLLINGWIGHEGQQWPHNHVNLKHKVLFLAPLVHTGILLTDITSTLHNPTLSRYLTWLGDFNLIRYIPMSNRNDQYLIMPMWSM